MKEINIKARGKINLMLDVTGKRKDGYHDISTIMQSVDLYDDVFVSRNNSGIISVSTNFDELVEMHDNIAYKAAVLMREKYRLSCGFDIKINKIIPIAGGMGGGSANAAAVIKAVNLICDLGLSVDEMMQTGLALGADVPFCIYEKCALAHGVGEKLTPVNGLCGCKILIVNPNISVLTKDIYDAIDRENRFKIADEDYAVKVLEEMNYDEFENAFCNSMQSVTESLCPEVSMIIRNLKAMGAKCALMSGSGPTCFGIFTKFPDEAVIQEKFKNYFTALVNPY